MITILIVDDNPEKIKTIKQAIFEIPEIHPDHIDIAPDINTAKNLLLEKQFDLMVLDLFLPERFGDNPEKDAGINFLQEINITNEYILPFHIIGLTAYEELHVTYEKEFKKYLWHVIMFEQQYETWKNQFITHLNYLIKSKRELRNPSNVTYEYDIGIITALNKPELSSILRLDANWANEKIRNDYTTYYKGLFKNDTKSLKIVCATADQMGLVAATNLAQKMIVNFRPRYLIMTGIAAGVKGKANFGDIVIADLVWDYGSGKIVTGNRNTPIFKQDPRAILLLPELRSYVQEEERSNEIISAIDEKWLKGNGEHFPHKLKLILGPIASGSYVIAHLKKVQEVTDQQRKLVGIDMESYATFYAATYSSDPKPKPMVVKSICDFGDARKSDKFQNYAAFTSSNFLYNFALKYL